jgi:hypothetical protein
MATPAAHKAAAEAFFVRLTAPGYASAGTAEHLEAEVHAHLSKRVGTGTHYVAAEGILAALPPFTMDLARQQALQQAIIHAVMAD